MERKPAQCKATFQTCLANPAAAQRVKPDMLQAAGVAEALQLNEVGWHAGSVLRLQRAPWKTALQSTRLRMRCSCSCAALNPAP